ncbi:MAG: type II secretion system protein GspJ [Myxococcota bacterium]|nr:type II secretion system protein GspJ [Myxococcota bacterium]
MIRPPSPQHATVRSRAGFTLLEIMMSIAILAGIMVVAWGTYGSAIRQQERMQQINNRLHGVEQAMHRVVREISMAFVTPHGAEESQVEIRYRTAFIGKQDRIDFASLAYVRMFRDDKVGDQCELAYYLRRVRDEDGNWVQALVRREQAPIDEDPEKGGTVMTLLEDVSTFELQYWDPQKAEIAVGNDGWIDDWDTQNSEPGLRLPSRVRITIGIPDPVGRDELLFTSEAEIRLVDPLDF